MELRPRRAGDAGADPLGTLEAQQNPLLFFTGTARNRQDPRQSATRPSAARRMCAGAAGRRDMAHTKRDTPNAATGPVWRVPARRLGAKTFRPGVSNPQIDSAHATARANGAPGRQDCRGRGGGF
jgi:hypothetical protein